MSEEQEHIDHCGTYIFNQGLTQADIALCLAIIDNIHNNVRNLRRKLARLQLYRWCSGPDVVVASLLNDGQTLSLMVQSVYYRNLRHLNALKSLYPLSARCTVNHFITFSKNHAGTLQTLITFNKNHAGTLQTRTHD